MSHKKKIDIDPLNPIVNIKGQLFSNPNCSFMQPVGLMYLL